MPSKITDTKGREITLTSRQKNEIYRKAQYLREEIRSGLITKTQQWDPSDYNIRECVKRENNPKFVDMVNQYRKSMEAIGADPKDIGTERLRKGR